MTSAGKRKRAPGEKWTSQVPTWTEATRDERMLLDAAWREGELSFLLTPSQLELDQKLDAWEERDSLDARVFVIDSSRRWGKSVLLCKRALEKCRKYPGWRVVYVCPTHEQVRKIVLPLIAQLVLSCPPTLIPKWVKSEGQYVFANGARLELVGLDVNPDGARGTGVDYVLLDEAGFFDSLEYLLVSIIQPQMLGRPHARVIAASTPPVTPMHYWSATLVPDCISRESHDRKTLDDADQYSDEEIEYFYSMMPGGRNGTAARREYGAEHIADETLQVIPEFRDAEGMTVREVEPPLWRDCYVALDPGFHDLSAILFGYWHFAEQTLVVEDEIVAPRLNSSEIAAKVKAKEDALWGRIRRRGASGSWDTKPQPYLRVADNDLRLIADLSHDHGLHFVPIAKDKLAQQVDQVRVAIQSGKIAIHPRCRKLVLHLRNAVWKKPGSVFAREGGDFGHFDTVAALVYMWRGIQKGRNPLPPLERVIAGDLRTGQLDNDNAKPSKWMRKGHRFYLQTGKKTA